MDIETLNSESTEFLDIVIEEICEYEDWNVYAIQVEIKTSRIK